MLTPEILSARTVEPAAVLESLAGRAREIFSLGKVQPLVLFDLDDTLFDRRPRTMKILADLVLDASKSNPLDANARAAVAKIKPRMMKYHLEDTLAEAGVTEPAIVRWMVKEHVRRSGLDPYVMFDLPSPGGVDFVRELSKAGAMTIYLGGLRNRDRARFGTERSISMYELPAPRGEIGALFMSDKEVQNELEFKRGLIEPIRSAGEVIGAFDNDPDACNLFREQFPDAAVVLLDSIRPSDDVELLETIGVMKNFRG